MLRLCCSHYSLLLQEITVDEFKKLIEERTGLPPGEQRLIFEGKQLEDGKKLSMYRITKNATIFLVMRLVGGAKRPDPPLLRKIDPSIPRMYDNVHRRRECEDALWTHHFSRRPD